MFQYEYEKRPPSTTSCDSGATASTDWSRRNPVPSRGPCRPLPPRPVELPAKTTVPLKIWIIASASCFAVCAALVLATVVITKWGTGVQYTREVYAAPPEPIYYNTKEHKEEIEIPVLEKLSMFKNVVANRERNKSLLSKHQMHPLHEEIDHQERKIEKKDKAKSDHKTDDESLNLVEDLNENKIIDSNYVPKINQVDINDNYNLRNFIPEFKPIVKNIEVKLPESFVKYKQEDYEEYYDDVNIYDDYIQSNSLTNYMIEKVQELHDWVVKDPDFDKVKNSTKRDISNDFSQVLKALNSSLVEGNVSIIMNTLRDVYFGGKSNESSESIIKNSTDLVTFGILSLDVMLLHNIQMMAWENQESARIKMMRDPDVFAFNALFLDHNKMEAMENEIQTKESVPKRQNKQDMEDDFGKHFLSSILDIGMSTARAAIHLGRAYKNTRTVLNQLATKETQNQISRDIVGNTQVLSHLQATYNGSVASSNEVYTELDCVWLLYCRNLVATSKLNPPYGTMARINGVALRMLTGELSADRAIDTMLYEAFTGWTELKCNDMFPKCSKVNAAAIVMDNIIQPLKKHHQNKG